MFDNTKLFYNNIVAKNFIIDSIGLSAVGLRYKEMILMKMMKKSIMRIIVVVSVILVGFLGDIIRNYSNEALGSTNQTSSSTSSSNTSSNDITSQIISGEKTYTEQNINLPNLDYMNGEMISSMLCNPKGLCEVFTIKYMSSKFYDCSRYTLINGVWESTKIEWAKAFGSSTTKFPKLFQYSPDGNLYCIVNDNVNSASQQQLAKISDEGSIEIIDTPALSTKTNYFFPNVASYDITTDNQFVFANLYGGICSYDLMTGKMLFTKDCFTNKLAITPNTISYVDMYSGNLNVIDISTGREISHHPLLKSNTEYSNSNPMSVDTLMQLFYVQLYSDGTDIYVADKNGIYTFGSDKQVYFVGSNTYDINRPGFELVNFSMDNNGSFYTLTHDTNYNLYLKSYSPINSSDIKYQSTLTIALYKEDERITETLYLFKQKHPEIKIDYINLSEKDTLSSQKNKLEQSDIIVCGSNIYPALKANGILKEIGDTAQSLVKSEGLYPKIIDALYEKDGLYVMPTEFTPYIYAGNKTLLASTNSLDSLKKYAKKNGSVWTGMGYEALGYVNYQFFYPMITNNDGTWNKAELKKLLSSFKQTCTISKSDVWSSEDEWFNTTCYSNYLHNNNSLLATEINEADDLMILLAALYIGEGSYKCSGSFETSSLVTINKSADTTLVSEFLSILYGIKAQSALIGNGIPMKINSLDAWSEIQYTNRRLYNSNGIMELEGTLLTSTDIKKFKDMLKKVTKYIAYDPDQASSMAQSMKLYLTGSSSLTDTTNKIVTGTAK